MKKLMVVLFVMVSVLMVASFPTELAMYWVREKIEIDENFSVRGSGYQLIYSPSENQMLLVLIPEDGEIDFIKLQYHLDMPLQDFLKFIEAFLDEVNYLQTFKSLRNDFTLKFFGKHLIFYKLVIIDDKIALLME